MRFDLPVSSPHRFVGTINLRKVIPSYPDYSADDDGQIYRNDQPDAPLKKRFENGGTRVSVRNGTRKATVSVHKLVWEAFRGPVRKYAIFGRCNGDVWDTSLANITMLPHKGFTHRPINPQYGPWVVRSAAYDNMRRRWRNMLRRCNKPNSESERRHYRARGISVCERWERSFEDFYADMGDPPTPQHSIDRINNDGNYEPSNCRWATKSEQVRNSRNTKFNEDSVRQIRKLRGEGVALKNLAAKFNTSSGQIHAICSRKLWKDVT